MEKLRVYTEVVYKEQEDGTCNWLGRVYNRVGPAKVLKTQDGIAPSRAAALIAAKSWSAGVLDAARERETVVLTADDVEVLNLEDLNLE